MLAGHDPASERQLRDTSPTNDVDMKDLKRTGVAHDIAAMDPKIVLC